MSLASWFKAAFDPADITEPGSPYAHPYAMERALYDNAVYGTQSQDGEGCQICGQPIGGTHRSDCNYFNLERARPKPRLAHVTRAPTRDEFDRWRDDPVTEFVMAAVKRNSEEQREEWMRRSWDGGEADQEALTALRERADALEGFAADYEAFCETLNLEPNEGESE